MSLVLMGYLDPRLLSEVGDLVLSTYLSQLFLRALRKRERVSKPAKLRIRGASPLRTQRVCVLSPAGWLRLRG